MPFKISKPHYNQWEVSRLFEVVVNLSLEVPTPRYGWIYKIFFMQLQTKDNMRLQLGTFQLTLAWILWLCCQLRLVSKGNECHANTSITCYNMYVMSLVKYQKFQIFFGIFLTFMFLTKKKTLNILSTISSLLKAPSNCFDSVSRCVFILISSKRLKLGIYNQFSNHWANFFSQKLSFLSF
jgi:hypothetical protein